MFWGLVYPSSGRQGNWPFSIVVGEDDRCSGHSAKPIHFGGIDLPPPHELEVPNPIEKSLKFWAAIGLHHQETTKKLWPDAIALRFMDSRISIEFLPLANASEAARRALL